jgi:hypothetical protein
MVTVLRGLRRVNVRFPPALAIASRFPQACSMNLSFAQTGEGADPYGPDGAYALARLGLSLLVATLVGDYGDACINPLFRITVTVHSIAPIARLR